MNKLYDIPDFYGYKIDKDGNIYSFIGKGCRNRYDKSKWTFPVKLKYRYTNAGYARVYMRRESTNKREDIYVHRLVAMMFVDNPYNLTEVNHLNSIRSDNRADNLEWCTHIDNLQYAKNQGHVFRNKTNGRYESAMV